MTTDQVIAILSVPVGGLLIGLWGLYFARSINKEGRKR